MRYTTFPRGVNLSGNDLFSSPGDNDAEIKEQIKTDHTNCEYGQKDASRDVKDFD